MGMQLTPMFDKTATIQPEDMITWIEAGMHIEVLERGKHFFVS
jgi:hypothetical protein